MKGSKYLAKNIGLLTISQFGTKMLGFFLIPLYTNVLSTSEYGTYDLFNSTISLMIPILTLNICDSTLRFSIDEQNDKKDIYSISLFRFNISILIVMLAIIINWIFNFFPIVNDFSFLFFLMFVGTSFNSIMTYFARGIDCVKEVAISGAISSALILLLNILFLVPLHMGLLGYFLANISGIFGQSLYLFLAVKGWRYVKLSKLNPKMHKEMVAYSQPMIVNNISWWVNNVSDRYVVTWLCGIAANGIYSVSYKIPSILTIVQSIFNQAWTLSAIRDFDPNDENGFFTGMYNSYNVCMTIICSMLIVASRIIAKFLYAKDFFIAWKYVPFLLISVVFGALSGYIGGIFGAVKDTKIFAQSTFASAIVNIVLNIILVSKIGVVGAAISTAISYLVTWIIRIVSVRKYIKLKLNLFKDCISYLILVIQSIILYIMDDSIAFYTVELAFIVLILIIHRSQMQSIYAKLRKMIGGKLNYAKQ